MNPNPAFRALALVAAFGAACGSTGCTSSSQSSDRAMAGATNIPPGSTEAGAGSTAAGASASGGSAAGADNAGSSAGGAAAGGAAAGFGGDLSSAGAGGETSGSAGAAEECPGPAGGPITTTTTHLNIAVHDPSLIWNGARYDLFATGGRLNIQSSVNLQQWSSAGSVFSVQPAWIATALGSAPADLWAPDVSYFNCAYHVYYAGSSFGSNNSVIGLATNPTLDPTRPDYQWTDRGQVVRSRSSDDYNAIDPNLAFDEAGAAWLSFGSFWSGIKLLKIDASTGKPSSADTTIYSIAGRNGGAIEAPSIVSHNGFYYLFVSYDACCKGVQSTYRTMVGRATKVTGPYLDKAGAAMTSGNAEPLLASAGRYIGPGGGTAFRNGATYLYAFHYYDGMDNGASKLSIRPINWDSADWPVLGEPLFP